MTALRSETGGRIDRTRPLRFTFDGRALSGFAGDTLASALLANGIHLVGRSFKYHRPRGILAAGAEEPNALVTVHRGGGRETPNLRATQVELYEGLTARSQNRWPSLRHDVGGALDLVSPLFPAGFYYKTFMWPAALWSRLYEPAIRRTAGLGRAPKGPDPDRYLGRYAHCEVLIVGAGPAGIAAALAAAEGGGRIMLCDEQAEFGGSLLAETRAIEGRPAGEWVAEKIAELAAKGVRLLPRTTAFGYFLGNFVALAERVTDHLAEPDPSLPRERLWQVRAKEVVLATGAIERPLVSPENDRPGIMLADAARTYANRYGVRPGTRAVVMAGDDSAYRAALDLKAAGVTIAAIADRRGEPGMAAEAARAAGIDVRTNTEVAGTLGGLRVRAVDLATADGAGERLACDLALMAGGWTPSVHLFSQSRGRLRFDAALDAFVPDIPAERVRSAGGCRGIYETAAAMADGYAAGEAAARDAQGKNPSAEDVPHTSPRWGEVVSRTTVRRAGEGAETPQEMAVPPHPDAPHPTSSHRGDVGAPSGEVRSEVKGRAFVDFQNDVTTKDLKLALREGFRSIEHVKRYTTTGMATDQGKTSSMNALGIVAGARGRSVPEVGLTTFRMPYTPVTFGTLAGTARGALFDPVRKTPIHDWAEAEGAVFEDVGLWKRARYFPRPGEDMHAAVARECKAVRTGVGIFDASTLGKIEIVGPDAAEFMNRLYTNSWSKLEPGRCRYGVMLTEAGFVMDDGVVGRLAPDRFHVTTTTGGAPRVLHHMEDYLQTEFPELKVWLTSTTEQWAVIAIQGPKSREVVRALCEGVDLSPEAMPHMSVRPATIWGVPGRLFRVSFTGELGYELNVPASHGRTVWEMAMRAGQAYGITPYGTETMHVLRAEKGYIIVGQESDGTVIPSDLGLDWAIGRQKPDFVGKRSLARRDMLRNDRKQLVGLLTEDPNLVLEEGAQIVASRDAPIPAPMLGHVTSSYRSATLGRSIALGLVAGGRGRLASRLYVPLPGKTVAVEVVDPVFYDKDGERLDG
ncbi:MAG TPA: sarcosine oxidase subunit alpha family protein [Bauldia sp.]|nr:sarcosine oxidase subunit alpha family protein [Bauldia sp.]